MAIRLASAAPLVLGIFVLASCTAGSSSNPSFQQQSASPSALPAQPTPAITIAPTIRVIPTREPTPTLEPTVARQEIVLVDHGFTGRSGSTPVTTYGVVLRNPNASHWAASRVSINIAFLDAGGSVIGTENDSAGPIAPGWTFAVGDDTFPEGVPATMKVTVTSNWEETDETNFGAFQFSGVKTTKDSFSTKTSGLVGTTFRDEPSLVQIVAIYRNASGAVIGGGRTYADKIPAGQTVGFTISVLVPLTAAKTEVYGLL
jgi:hypothetical protein